MVQLYKPVVLNVTVFLLAVLLKIVLVFVRKVRSCRTRKAVPSAYTPLLDPTAFSKSVFPEAAKHNYLSSLKATSWLFTVLSLLNFCVYLPLDGGWSMVSGDGNYSWLRQSLMQKLDDGQPEFLDFFYIYLFVGNGLVVLLFTRILESRLRIGHLGASMTERMRRTVWLSSIPKEDLQTGDAWELSDKNVTQVENDLAKALNDQLVPSWNGDPDAGVVEVLRVAVRVDTWADVKLALERSEERFEMYSRQESDLSQRMGDHGASKVTRCLSCCTLCKKIKVCCLMRRYKKTRDRLRREGVEKERLEGALNNYEQGKKQLSGSAFVTLKTEEAAQELLERHVPCWRLDRDHTFFTFGRPPFASVTLQCRRAPPPRDIVWEHLHNDYRLWNFVWYIISSVLLFLVMLIIVTPTTLVSMVSPVLRIMNDNIDQLEEQAESSELSESTKMAIVLVLDYLHDGFISSLVEQLPTLILLTINAVVLPSLIEVMGRCERCYRKSTFELHQKQRNHVFLFLNTLVFPLIGVTSVVQIVKLFYHDLETYVQKEENSMFVLDTLTTKLQDSSAGLYGLKYLLTSTFISGAFALLDVGQAIYRCFGSCCVVTERDRRELREPAPFAWGYWYAWNSTIFSLIFLYCCFVPAMLPVGALFFFMRHSIDKFNLVNRVYVAETDIEGTLAFNLIRDMRITVAGTWFLAGMAGMFAKFLLQYFSMEVSLAETWEFRILGACLVIASIVVTFWAFWVYRKQCLDVELGGRKKPWRDPNGCFERTVGKLAGCFGIQQLEEKEGADDFSLMRPYGQRQIDVGHAWDSLVCLGLVMPTVPVVDNNFPAVDNSVAAA